MGVADNFVALCLVPLALWLLASGLDDLWVDIAWLFQWARERLAGARGFHLPEETELARAPEKRIAIFVPLWREDKVIGSMLEHNIAAIRYSNYHFFVGAYPNDEPTLDAVREAESRFPRVHLALCPHDGPTSKADCLNWIFQQMLLFEEQERIEFDIMVLHDAEDVIHAGSLRLINYFADDFDMVQVPVLPLATPFGKLTHGLYCEEFAEFQAKDLWVRGALGGFLPSSGVGTGYTRRAMDRLAAASANCLFDPACLTEDYDIGLRLHNLGFRQLFIPVQRSNGIPVATREFFPSTFRDAVKQRTRWVTGIALQTWEKYGWGKSCTQRYWFWRDRKGLAGSPVSLVTNLLFLYGVLSWCASRIEARPWVLAEAASHPFIGGLMGGTAALQCLRLGVRIGFTARIYGLRFALGAPLRVCWGNWINAFATASALRNYLRARRRRLPLVWLKTEHTYPSRAALTQHKRRLGEILVGSGYLSAGDLAAALRTKPAGIRLGEHLIRLGKLTEEELYEALSLQHNVPFERLEPAEIARSVACSLPAAAGEKWKVLPFKVEAGKLFVAGPELPSEEMHRELRQFTRLEIRFHFITPSNLAELHQELLA